MIILTDKITLLTSCSLLLLYPAEDFGLLQILSFLTAIIFTCLLSCCNTEYCTIHQLSAAFRKTCCGLCTLFALLTLLIPPLGYYLPCLIYEISVLFWKMPFEVYLFKEADTLGKEQRLQHGEKYILFSLCLPAVLLIQVYRNSQNWLLLLLCVLAYFLSMKSRQLMQAQQSLHLLRDTSTENQILLRQKNQNLILQQDNEIRMATLKERNRIAREIHDNVGHLLSRSLLQAGALAAINQQKSLIEPLDALKLTLNSAMNSIRESVHDLHDDSIDLKSSIQELLSEFASYQTTFDYDMKFTVPASIKYCFISIVKEALSNIARHSSATSVSITLREHPLLYQLVISDNGTADNDFQPGMGITNMEERVKHLKGNFSVSTDHGFRIFISVPVSQ